jgi:hypothetical protein
MARSSLYLADSNILLRLSKGDHPEFPLVRGAIRALTQKGMTPAYTLQNMTEFWNASTRPKERRLDYAPCRYWGVSSPDGVTKPARTRKSNAFSLEEVTSLVRASTASSVFFRS